MTLKNTRECKKCKIRKDLTMFESYTRKNKVSHRTICKDCIYMLRDSDIYTKCQVCHKFKDRSLFPKSSNASIGIELTCKSCKKKAKVASGIPQIINRDRKGRYKSDPEFRQRLKNHSKLYREKYKERHMLSQARIRARNSNLPFNITVEDIVIPKTCPILGIELVINNKKRLWNSASLDKVDNTLGYVKGNVRVISYMANHMKGKFTRQELEMFSKNIILYLDNMI